MSKNKGVPKKRKARKKKTIAVSLAGVLVAGGIGGAVYYKQNSEAKMPAETKKAQSATAELGSISNTIVGTGNLTLSDAQSQTIPSGIEIEEVMVESGDTVTKGETIATVSKASVLKAVEETQEEIKELDEQISDCQDADDTDSIDASVDGRVKLIYAESGDDITDVMLENGSVLVLSLDGKMAVDIKAAGLEKDDTVTVTLSSGTQVTGTVESVTGAACTVTVTDNGTEYDDEVTVTDNDGKELGTGKLYIHEPLEVTGTTGTVSAVNVSENESVTSGTELFTLENSTDTMQYEQLLAEREAYSATLKKLLQLSKNQKITADISGTVQSVNVSANSSDSSSSNTSSSSSTGNSGTSGISKMSYTTSSQRSTVPGEKDKNDSQAGVIRLSSTNISAMSYTSAGTSSVHNFISTSAENTEECENTKTAESETVPSAAGTEKDIEMQTEFVAETESEETADEDSANPATALTLRITTEGQTTAGTLAIAAPVTGNIPTGEVAAADGSYTGSISWNPGDGSFQAGTVYQANVTLYAGQGYVFTGSSINGIDTGIVSGVTVSADGSTLSFTITYPQTAGDSGDGSGNGSDNNSQDGKNNNSSDGNSDGFSDADKSDSDKTDNGNNSGSTGSAGDSSRNDSQGNASGNQSGTSGNMGTNGSSGTGSSGGSTASAQSGSGATSADTKSDASSSTSASSDSTDLTSSYSTEVEAFTISSDENMVLAVSVDELDINSVELGQEAVVELDAIEDETFTGEVTAVGDTASASGGVAKYTVSLTIPKDDRMKQGMNASATITIDSRENVITIPVNALQEEGSKVFVYTEEDDDGNLSGEKEVTTGLSDGTTVEITDGLEEGETVYYNKTGSTQNSTSGSDGFPGGDFDGGNGGPGGDMPSDNNGAPGGNSGQGGGNGQGGGPGNMPNM